MVKMKPCPKCGAELQEQDALAVANGDQQCPRFVKITIEGDIGWGDYDPMEGLMSYSNAIVETNTVKPVLRNLGPMTSFIETTFGWDVSDPEVADTYTETALR